MIVKELPGRAPRLHPSVRMAENVTVVGDVRLEADVTVWYGSVLRGDVGPISVGRGSNIQENSVLHCAAGGATTVGEDVTVGHGAILHGCTVEDGCFIGMWATVLDGAVIGAGAMIGAGALVGPGKIIPPGSLVVGVPGRVVRQLTEEEKGANLANSRGYVLHGLEELEPL